MKRVKFYTVENATDNFGKFNTIWEAKDHILMGYSDREKSKYFHEAFGPVICGLNDEGIVSTTGFYSDKNGKVTFKKTERW